MGKAHCTAILLAGGRGKRMGTAQSKMYLLIQDKPVLYYSLDVFEKSGVIDEVVLVAGKGQIPYCRREIVEKYGFQKVKAIVEGGAERYHSVWEGLRVLEKENKKGGYVFIHDGARPFINEEILERSYEEVCKSRACVVGMPVKDTIKIADEKGCIHMTPNRSLVWQIQTPQVFAEELIIPAYREVIEKEQELLSQGIQITDDAMVVENVCGCPVRLVEGSYANLKITTPEDLEIARIFADEKEL
ncbi:MAG: 2-C-methyl-D-erythritol 4-phosphate cytidylyltransferase [Lachnospiraceae bacterium]|nr:2-C-methyl-D-erythritol 4-phosphate cytidylyltransferase [Lachnospiraceae bacterium]